MGDDHLLSKRKLKEARRQGQLPLSPGFTSFIVLIGAFAVLYFFTPWAVREFADLMKEVYQLGRFAKADFARDRVILDMVSRGLRLFLVAVLPFGITGLVFRVLSTFAQIGVGFTFGALKPDFSRLSPMRGLSRVLSIKNALLATKWVSQALVVLLILFYFIREWASESALVFNWNPKAQIGVFAAVATRLSGLLGGALAFFVIVELVSLRWLWKRGLQLTPAEKKRELKDEERDPLVKQRVVDARLRIHQKNGAPDFSNSNGN